MLRRPDTGTLEQLITTVWVPCAAMVRMSMSPSTEPYWSKRASKRFDDPSDLAAGDRFGVLYLAQDLPTAFCESVIHENSNFVNGKFEVSRSEIDNRQLTSFRHYAKNELELIDLTGEALKKLGLNNDISAGDDYDIPQEWSKALHDAASHVDGIQYVSRQRNRAYCYAIFERSELAADWWRPLTEAEKDLLCTQFNVAPV